MSIFEAWNCSKSNLNPAFYNPSYKTIYIFDYKIPYGVKFFVDHFQIPNGVELQYILFHEVQHAYQHKHYLRKYEKMYRVYNDSPRPENLWVEKNANKFARKMIKRC